jgi:hypothetical protein
MACVGQFRRNFRARPIGWAAMRLMAFGGVVFLAISLPVVQSIAQSPKPPSGTHVYLFRGFLNIFSLGMDGFGNELLERGIPASVYNHVLWNSAADDAVRNYKSGRTHTIIAIGHSMGASAVIDMVEYLGERDIPVALAITLDGPTTVVSSGQVHRFINLYISNGVGGPLTKGSKFSGTISNIDVSQLPYVGHFTIDKLATVQKMLLTYVNQAIHASQGAATPRAVRSRSPGTVLPTARPTRVPATPPRHGGTRNTTG